MTDGGEANETVGGGDVEDERAAAAAARRDAPAIEGGGSDVGGSGAAGCDGCGATGAVAGEVIGRADDTPRGVVVPRVCRTGRGRTSGCACCDPAVCVRRGAEVGDGLRRLPLPLPPASTAGCAYGDRLALRDSGTAGSVLRGLLAVRGEAAGGAGDRRALDGAAPTGNGDRAESTRGESAGRGDRTVLPLGETTGSGDRTPRPAGDMTGSGDRADGASGELSECGARGELRGCGAGDRLATGCIDACA